MITMHRAIVRLAILSLAGVFGFALPQEAGAQTISATAQGSVTPLVATFPATVMNGDFEIVGSATTPTVGDGADEGTLWTFDFKTDPNYSAFPTTGSLATAVLTLTLTPKAADVSTDQLAIRDLGIKDATAEIRSLPLDVTTTVQVELADPAFYAGAAILATLVNENGTLAMLYVDDAVVSFAQLDLVAVTEVAIDVKPGDETNTVNLGASGVIPVAILSSATFYAPGEVNPGTLTLAGASVRVAGRSGRFICHTADVNHDILADLICHFENDLTLEPGDSIVVLEGQTLGGDPIRGQDTIRIVPSN